MVDISFLKEKCLKLENI